MPPFYFISLLIHLPFTSPPISISTSISISPSISNPIFLGFHPLFSALNTPR